MNRIVPFIVACMFGFLVNAQSRLAGVPTVSGQVLGIAPVGDTVYVWGSFGQLGDSSRNGLGSFNIRTGKVTAFRPYTNAYTQSAKIAGNKMIIQGNFDTVGTYYTQGIGMVNLNTGQVENWTGNGANTFSADPFGSDSTYFYFFNAHTSVIQRVNYSTLTTSLWQTPAIPWYQLNAITVADSFLYVGGNECHYTGADTMFNYVCRFNKNDGSLDRSWHPWPNCTPGSEGINSIGINRYKQLFVAGYFTSIAGQARQGIAGFDANGTLTNFNPVISSNESFKVDVTDNDVWLGCNSYLIGGENRWRLAEIDISTGTASCWDASAFTNGWSSCNWVSVVGDTVYAANYGNVVYVFTGSPRPHPAYNIIQGANVANPGQTITYFVPDSAGYTYSWRLAGGTGYSIGDSIAITWGNGPLGIIKLVENNNNYSTCSSDTVELLVNIASCPAMADSINGPANAMTGQTVNYSVPATAGAAYNWIVTGGNGTSSTSNIVVTWGNGSSGTVQLIETNDSLPICHTDTLILAVALLPNAVQNIDKVSANAFPNPTTGKVKMITTGVCHQYSIYDMEGQLLLTAPVTTPIFDTDLSGFSQGVYIVVVHGIDKQTYVKLTKL